MLRLQSRGFEGEDGGGPGVGEVRREALKGCFSSGDCLCGESGKCEHGEASVLELLDLQSSKISLPNK